MKRWIRSVFLVVVVVAMACEHGDTSPVGGDDDNNGGGGGDFFRATIAGQPWASDVSLIQVVGSPVQTAQGMLTISGSNSSSPIMLQMNLSFIHAPGTYPLGIDLATTPGGIGQVIDDADSWETWLTGSAGTVTISARTSTRVAGTFNFTATASPGTPPGTRPVTAGAFDITVATGLPPLPGREGSTCTANLGGTPWTAATVTGSSSGPGLFSFGATSLEHAISLTTTVPVVAGNTYGIPSDVTIFLQHFDSGGAWNGGAGADVGSVTITTFEAGRLVATFSGTFPSTNAGDPLVVTGGAINTFLQD